MTTLVLIDDETNILNSMNRLFRGRGWQVRTFSSPQQAISELPGSEVDLIISDYRMPQIDGVETLNRLREIFPDALRLLMSGQADMDGVLKAINEAEIYRFITKPWVDSELLMTIDNALRHQQLMLENQRLAAQVRQQQGQINEQLRELNRLEKENPGLTSVKRDLDGSIDFSDEYGEED